MDLEERVVRKFNELLSSGASLKIGNEYDQVRGNDHSFSCKGWLASAQNLVHLVVTNSNNPYRKTVDEICSKDRGLCIHESVGEVTHILQTLLTDIKQGLLVSVENQTKALVFDDFLDHAKWYVKKNKKNEAGVISGVVFEDTLRSLCRSKGIEETGVSLEQLIADLTKIDAINQTKAKRARVAAHVRTKATHAQWDEFELSDVKTSIEFTEEIINTHLS